MGNFRIRSCLTYIVYVFNFAVLLLGVAVLGVGVWLKVSDHAHKHVQDLLEVHDPHYQIHYSAYPGNAADLTVKMAYALMAAGVVLVLVAALGCLAAHKESPCLVTIASGILLALTIALLAVGVWAHQKRLRGYDPHDDKKFQKETYDRIHYAFTHYKARNETVKARAHDFLMRLQDKFECCGGRLADGEWTNIGVNPASVCTAEARARRRGCEAPYHKWAADEIKDWLDSRYEVIAGISLGVAVCLALGCMFSVLFCCILKRTTTITVN